MGKVIWTDPALKDLHDIIEHIAEDSPVYAERFGLQVVESPRRLEQFPYCGRIVPEFNDENIRELIYGSLSKGVILMGPGKRHEMWPRLNINRSKHWKSTIRKNS